MIQDLEQDANFHVIKRNGKLEEVSFDKILKRLKTLGEKSNFTNVPYSQLAMKVIEQLINNIPTTKIDELCAEECIARQTTHLKYGVMAARIIVSNHHKNIKISTKVVSVFSKIQKAGLFAKEFWETVQQYKDKWDEIIQYDRDYLIDYFGFKTLEKSYLIRVNGKVVECAQHMWLRVAIAIHVKSRDLQKIKESYDLMSLKYYTHATPTLFNAGLIRGQYSSCFLSSVEDSIEGIYDCLKECAIISKYAGGIGLHIHKIRAKGSFIHGTNGTSNGLVPMMGVFNATADYVDQGGGKRNGSIALYLEPWHADILGFLSAKRNQGEEKTKSRDLFYALWMPDLFMKRLLAKQSWSLFCPHECPQLSDVYGEEFETLYQRYESEGRARALIPAAELWTHILDTQMETGTPYILYKDAINRKSNQSNVGIIRSSNLCTEIMEYSDENETAVCNLASIGLPSFLRLEEAPDSPPMDLLDCLHKKVFFDYEKLHQVVEQITENLNHVIDLTFYPIEKARKSNLRHRPIGIGVQGLADTLVLLDIAYDSEEAREVNVLIFETIYHAALTKSTDLAEKEGAYASFDGSPTSKGLLQFDLWKAEEKDKNLLGFDWEQVSIKSGRYNWDILKARIQRVGLRNSLLVAPMPTASTSQILGFNECFEPFTCNIYTRRTLVGEFTILNKYLVKELMNLGIWSEELKNNIIQHGGSIQHLTNLSEKIRNKYKIVWEMPQKQLIDMAADRAPFICQSQSMNLWVAEPNYTRLNSMFVYGWKRGLKTGLYYLRTKAKHHAEQFTIDPDAPPPTLDAPPVCTEEICSMCSS